MWNLENSVQISLCGINTFLYLSMSLWYWGSRNLGFIPDVTVKLRILFNTIHYINISINDIISILHLTSFQQQSKFAFFSFWISAVIPSSFFRHFSVSHLISSVANTLYGWVKMRVSGTGPVLISANENKLLRCCTDHSIHYKARQGKAS